MALKILITNDDGIDSLGIKLLIEKASKYGEVFVYAPLKEQSAKSHSINIKGGLIIQEKNVSNVLCKVVDSTPADCVRFAKYGDNVDFDIVFSGINKGYNLGEDIIYSGTVAAASEAILMGKKAIAFSSYYQGYKAIDEWFDKVMNFIFVNKLLEVGNLYNVNFPENPQGIKLTKQGSVHFDAYFEEDIDGHHQKGKPDFAKDLSVVDSDVTAIYNEYISISPLCVDRTDYNVLNLLKKSNN